MQFQHMTSTNPFDPTEHCFSQTIPVQQEKQDETIVKKGKESKMEKELLCTVLLLQQKISRSQMLPK